MFVVRELINANDQLFVVWVFINANDQHCLLCANKLTLMTNTVCCVPIN